MEVCFQAVTTGNIVNRGFLNGPWCPIYGVGMVSVLLLLGPISDNLALLFLGGMALCTLVELIVGWALEKIFHTRWWDYSNRPFQLGGYICLEFSLMWGLAVTFAVHLIHPAILGFVNAIPHVVGWVLAGILMASFAADFIVTLVTIVGIKKDLGELQEVADNLHAVSDAISERMAATVIHADSRLEATKEALERKNAETKAKFKEKLEFKVSETMQELQTRQSTLELRQAELRKKLFTAPKFRTRRLTGAFPDLKRALQEKHANNKTE